PSLRFFPRTVMRARFQFPLQRLTHLALAAPELGGLRIYFLSALAQGLFFLEQFLAVRGALLLPFGFQLFFHLLDSLQESFFLVLLLFLPGLTLALQLLLQITLIGLRAAPDFLNFFLMVFDERLFFARPLRA